MRWYRPKHTARAWANIRQALREGGRIHPDSIFAQCYSGVFRRLCVCGRGEGQ